MDFADFNRIKVRAWGPENESEVGYLRPFKRNLVDIFVSRETLSYALDTANGLFMAFEDRGHRVTLASSGEFHRPQLIVQGGPKPEYYNESWSPGRQTVVFIGPR